MSKAWPPSPVPMPPEEIVLAAKERRLVIFVGAGISNLMGCPSWPELAKRALNQLADSNRITYGDVDQLLHLDPKKQLSIAELIAKSDGAELDFKPLIEPEYQSS